MGAKQVLGRVWDELYPAFDHGRAEVGAALFNGSAYVMYQSSHSGREGVEGSIPEAPAQDRVSPEKPMGMDELRALAREAEATRGNEPERDNEMER